MQGWLEGWSIVTDYRSIHDIQFEYNGVGYYMGPNLALGQRISGEGAVFTFVLITTIVVTLSCTRYTTYHGLFVRSGEQGEGFGPIRPLGAL